MKYQTVGIVIVTYNSAATITRCLQTVLAIKYSHISVLIIDNSSTDKTTEIISQKFKQIQLIKNKKNIGFAAANNQAIKILIKKKCEYILLLNPDTEVKPDLIDMLLTPFSVDKKVGISGCAITYKDSKTIWFAGGMFNEYFCYTRHKKMNRSILMLNQTIHPTDFITGCCMMIHEAVINKIGFIDTAYEFYFEDADYCLRAKEAGYISSVIEYPLVFHRVSTSSGESGSNKLSPFKAYYFGRNPFFLMKSHIHGWKKVTAILGQFFIRLPFHGWYMIKNRDIQSLMSYLKGMKDGILLA